MNNKALMRIVAWILILVTMFSLGYAIEGNNIVSEVREFTIDNIIPPTITDVNATPAIQGFGLNVTIQANITDIEGVNVSLVEITDPNNYVANYTMENISDIYYYNYSNWINGTYYYKIFANDTEGTKTNSSIYSFQLYINLSIQVRTLKDNYSNNEIVNLTDPPGLFIPETFFNNIEEPINVSNSNNESMIKITGYLTKIIDWITGIFKKYPQSNKSIEIPITIYDSKQNRVTPQIQAYSEGKVVSTIISNQRYDIEVIINESIKKITFINMTLEEEMDIGIETLDNIEHLTIVKAFAIDPTEVNFTEAIVEAVASGTELWKCKDWNFKEQECYGTWEKMMDITPGQKYSFILTKEDPGFAELIIQQCSSENMSASAGAWPAGCIYTYPGTTLFTAGDGNIETYYVHKQGGTTSWAGIRIQSYNSSVSDCYEINNVYLCYKWWSSTTYITSCDISVDADSGNNYTAVTNVCPGTVEPGTITCVDVTLNETWTCDNFFTTKGAFAKSELLHNGAGGNAEYPNYWDVFYFNVSYNTTPDFDPNVTLEYPAQSYYNDSYTPYSLTFNCSITDDNNATNVSLYITDSLNQSLIFNDTCNITDVNGSCEWVKILVNGNYTWNCLGYDNQSQLDWGINRTVLINFTPIIDLTSPYMGFTSPTQDNDSIQLENYVEINVSINESNLEWITFNWDGTNYTIYNDSLVLMMNFDNISALEENNTYVVDLSGNENNGTCDLASSYCPIWTSSGKYKGTFDFDGIDDYINIGNRSSLNTNTSISIAAWIYLKGDSYADSDYQTIISKENWDEGEEHNDSYVFHIGDSNMGSEANQLTLGIYLNNTIKYGESSTGAISRNKWNYVVGTYNGSQIVIYINGLKNGSTPASGNIDPSPIDASIGGSSDEWNWFNGSIDELRIWNISMTADEVYQQYISNLNKYDTDKWLLYINQSRNATAGLTDGVYTYQAFASDTAGNVNHTEERTITIDNAAPGITLNYPDNDSTLNISSVNFNWTATDNLATVLSCNLTLDGVVNASGISSTNGTPTNHTVTCVSDAKHTWNISCWDNASNVNTSLTYSFTVDTIIPLINFTSPTPANGTTRSETWFEVNVTINELNLDEVRYNWNSTDYIYYNDSLVLMLNFDNVSALGENNTYVVDLSSFGNNGTGYNFDGDEVIDGRFNGAFDFDGIDDYVSIADSYLWDFANKSGTIELWFKASESQTDPQGYPRFFDHYTGGATPAGWYFGFVHDGDKLAFFNIHDGSGNNLDLVSTNTYNDSQWHHVTVTFNSSTAEMYIDGILDDTDEYSNLADRDETLKIGGQTTDNNLNGTIDEIRIWNISMTAEEVYQHYISNLNKYDTGKWLLYINQSKNATAGLTDGTYTYQTFVGDSAGNWNQTEARQVIIDTTAPRYNGNGSNNTNPATNDYVLLFVNWTDSNYLNYTWIGNNFTSQWINESPVARGVSTYNHTNITKVTVDEGLAICWQGYANDSLGNQNQTDVMCFFTFREDKYPNVTLNLPTASYENNTPDYLNISFNCSATDDFNVTNISLYMTNSTNSSFSFNDSCNINSINGSCNWTKELVIGNYTWNCLASDNSSQLDWDTNRTIVITQTQYVIYTEYEDLGETTDLSNVGEDNENVSLILDDAVDGKIKWNENISINNTYNLDEAVDISHNYVWVNATRYPSLNKPANITLYNLQLGYPYILKDGVECSDCSILNWNTNMGELTFNSSSFSNYTTSEANQSKLQNNGTTNTSVYILLKVQYWNGASWIDDDIVYNGSVGIINNTYSKGNIIKLDSLFNGKWNTSANASNGDGTYRVYAAALDNNNNVLRNIDGSYINVTYNFTITFTAPIANNSPIIFNVTSMPNQNPIASNLTYVYINFTATDVDCDLNDSSALVIFNKSSTQRQGSCTPIVINTTTTRYLCNVSMWYYDDSGIWDINVSVQDNLSNIAYNDTTNFTYNTLSAISINITELKFDSVYIRQAMGATNDPILINNTGNVDFTNISLRAYDLIGVTNSSYVVYANQFAASVTDSFTDVLENNTFINITDASLSHGAIATEELYLWVNVSYDVIAQEYNSSVHGPWMIMVE